MSEAAPAFTPSPGIPNQAHQIFYQALAKETGGASGAPKSSGQQFQTPESARRIEMMAAQHAKAATAGQSAAPASSKPTVDSIKDYQANRGKPAPSMVLDGVDNIAKVDAEMRAAGQQTGRDTVAAKDALIALKRSTPMAQQTSAWKAEWERKFAAADAAGETPAAEAKPAEIVQGTIQTAEQAVTVLDKALDVKGYGPAAAYPKEVLHGYRLPTFVAGQTYHAETLLPQLKLARDAGLSQAAVEAVIKADMRSRGFKV